ncbi:hypothetical protein M9H77_01998 [Catharanthus roseus]|uniref:Uncharacterized protein n=1 Tax=Catharanthus roseus TaxID=4058 RepID=A0ACC0C7K7_CATRO|nr:hypothetical protein M9H77_01998 [Catharanthus roseus]
MEPNCNGGDVMAQFKAFHRRLDTLQMTSSNNQSELYYGNRSTSQCGEEFNPLLYTFNESEHNLDSLNVDIALTISSICVILKKLGKESLEEKGKNLEKKGPMLNLKGKGHEWRSLSSQGSLLICTRSDRATESLPDVALN